MIVEVILLFFGTILAFWLSAICGGGASLILIPILNRAIVNLSGRELLKICLAIFVVFSLIPTLLNETVFGLGGGYSAIWLLLLYICGGFWGKYHEICLTHLPDFCFRHRLFLPFLFYLLCTTISFLLKMFGFQ